ncbi:hypothetical protein ACLOJK_022943 [Asimina triloba]
MMGFLLVVRWSRQTADLNGPYSSVHDRWWTAVDERPTSLQMKMTAGHGSSTMADAACPVRGLPILVVDQTLSGLLALCPLLEGETAADAAVDDGSPVCTAIAARILRRR